MGDPLVSADNTGPALNVDLPDWLPQEARERWERREWAVANLPGVKLKPHGILPMPINGPVDERQSMPHISVEEANVEVRGMIDAQDES